MTDPTPLHRAAREQRTRWLTDARDRQFRRDLTRLPELVALVATNPRPLRKGEPGPRPTPGSRPPLSLAAVALTDRRTRQDDTDVIGMAHLERVAGRRDGIEPTIRSWVILAEGEMLDEGEPTTPIPERQDIGADCAWLARHIVWVAEQQWVTELADVVRRAVRDCEQHLHIRPEYRPRCRRDGCGGRIIEEGSGLWRCDNCGHAAGDRGRLGLREVVARQEPMTPSQLHQAFGVTAARLAEWRNAGKLTPADAGGSERYHVTEVLGLMSDVEATYLHGHGQAKTLADIAEDIRIPVKTLHDWHSKGLIEPITSSGLKRGRLFEVGDVSAVARRLGRVS